MKPSAPLLSRAVVLALLLTVMVGGAASADPGRGHAHGRAGAEAPSIWLPEDPGIE